jgi:lysophospholipase L1-like esterase
MKKVNVSYTHESVRLTGRWDTSTPYCATATATGSYVEFAFEGRMALAKFDVVSNADPKLHLWVQLDGGDMIETPVDSYLRVIAKEEGEHICRIIYKGGTELDRRWYHPLTAKVSFIGVQTEQPIPIPADTRKTIEFVGDSITEGVLIDADFHSGDESLSTYIDSVMRCYQDDVCATYAWLTAEALDLRPIFMGYGAVGVTRAGCGNVPEASKSYPYNFENSPINHKNADYIVINHGANDRPKGVELYLQKYEELLDVIRAHNPASQIIALSAFCGAFHAELGEMIARYNQKHGCDVRFIDSNGWIPVEPLHPLRDGHRTVAEHLVSRLKEIVK